MHRVSIPETAGLLLASFPLLCGIKHLKHECVQSPRPLFASSCCFTISNLVRSGFCLSSLVSLFSMRCSTDYNVLLSGNTPGARASGLKASSACISRLCDMQALTVDFSSPRQSLVVSFTTLHSIRTSTSSSCHSDGCTLHLHEIRGHTTSSVHKGTCQVLVDVVVTCEGPCDLLHAHLAAEQKKTRRCHHILSVLLQCSIHH